MTNSSQSQLEDVFVDVRKAYRLLYLYQRRVLDTIEHISSILNDRGITGYSVFSNTAKDGKSVDFEYWAWDWLPMFCYEYKFDTKVVNGDKYDFAVAVYADNGYEDALSNVTQTDVEQFVPVEQSQTNLHFYVGKNMWKEEAFDAVWSSEHSGEYSYEQGDRKFLSLRYPLSKLKSEEEIVACLKEFRQFCHNNGMTNFLAQEL
jgi:hypothetical protein